MTAVLEGRGIVAGYGAGLVLHGIDFAVEPGQAVGLMGRNGMGKTTLIRALLGLLPLREGRVLLDGMDVSREPPFRRVRPGADGQQAWTLNRVLDTFPRLGQRIAHRGGQLSGGEQQMLAIGRALMTSPRLLILDEATEGLAPLVRDEIWRVIAAIRASGIATVVVDKTAHAVLSVVDRSTVLIKGKIVFNGLPATLQADPALMHSCLGV